MLYDDTIQPLVYSFRGNTDNNSVYSNSILAIIYTNKPARIEDKYFKVFIWEWENQNRDYVNSLVEELTGQHFFYSELPNYSFILDNNIVNMDYKELCSKISLNFIPTGEDFQGNASKDTFIYNLKTTLLDAV